MRVRFGDVRLDTAARQVWRGDEPIHLTRKAFDLLVLLFEQRPNAVTKEEIHQRLWPETFVSESSLQALVSEVRQALGDDGKRRAIVRTVHGVGYAFAADVSAAPPAGGVRQDVRAWLVSELQRMPLGAGENVIGRGEEDAIFVDDPTVSRRHAVIRVDREGATIEDLGSKNGTWLRDVRLQAAERLQDGDVILFGSARFTYRPARRAVSTESVITPSSE